MTDRPFRSPQARDILTRLDGLIGEMSTDDLPVFLGDLERLKAAGWVRLFLEPPGATKAGRPDPAAGGAGERLLTVNAAAQRLSLRPARVYELIRRGELPSVRLGERQVRIPARQLDAYLAQLPSRP